MTSSSTIISIYCEYRKTCVLKDKYKDIHTVSLYDQFMKCPICSKDEGFIFWLEIHKRNLIYDVYSYSITSFMCPFNNNPNIDQYKILYYVKFLMCLYKGKIDDLEKDVLTYKKNQAFNKINFIFREIPGNHYNIRNFVLDIKKKCKILYNDLSLNELEKICDSMDILLNKKKDLGIMDSLKTIEDKLSRRYLSIDILCDEKLNTFEDNQKFVSQFLKKRAK